MIVTSSLVTSAELAKVSPDTVARFERGEVLRDRTVDDMKHALESAGVIFIAENGGEACERSHCMTTTDETSRKTFAQFHDLPLYPSEAQIAQAVLGSRAKDWPRIAKVLEDKEGLPRVNELMGGRFWPAVVAFFYGWQHISLDGRVPENTPPSRFRIVPPKAKRLA